MIKKYTAIWNIFAKCVTLNFSHLLWKMYYTYISIIASKRITLKNYRRNQPFHYIKYSHKTWSKPRCLYKSSAMYQFLCTFSHLKVIRASYRSLIPNKTNSITKVNFLKRVQLKLHFSIYSSKQANNPPSACPDSHNKNLIIPTHLVWMCQSPCFAVTTLPYLIMQILQPFSVHGKAKRQYIRQN